MINYKEKLIKTYIIFIAITILFIFSELASLKTLIKINQENTRLRTELESVRDTKYIDEFLRDKEE